MMIEEYAEQELGTRDLEEADRRAAVVLECRRAGSPESPHDGRAADDAAALMVDDLMGDLVDGGRDE